MKADPQTIREVFSNGGYIQYRLPYFQREYTWGEDEWKTLLEDVFATYQEYVTERLTPEHFMGSLVRISDGVEQGIPVFTLVDGQQRLTTISLLLCAIRTLVGESDEDTANEMGSMITNMPKKAGGDPWYKLLPTEKRGDQAAYRALLLAEAPPQTASRITNAYSYLLAAIKEAVTREVDLTRLYETVLQCLQVVTIDLNRHEQPYKIFESLNGKGKPLTPADLIRNYIAMSLPFELQEKVFKTHWQFIDDTLQEQREVGSSGIGELTAFFRHYLAMRTRNLYAKEHIYERFRDRMEGRDIPDTEAFVREIATLHRAAILYDRFLRPKNEPDKDIRHALGRLQMLDMSTAFPFMLLGYERYEAGEITKAQWLGVLSALENYFVRRFLVGRQANYLNSMFPRLWDDINLHDFDVSLRESIARRQYPTDDEVRNAVRTRSFPKNGFQRLAFVLLTVNRKLSEGSGAYTALDGEPTIEHVMPQTLGEQWRADLGEGWQEVYERYLHTLGNLTLVTAPWNASLSNATFAIKRERLREHGLQLNRASFNAALEKWDETAILDRAEWLAEQILAIWPAFVQPQQPSGVAAVPVSVTIAEQTYPVSAWFEVLVVAANVAAATLGNEFAALAAKIPWLIVPEKPNSPQRHRQLDNGYWLNINHDRKRSVALAQRVIGEAGIMPPTITIEEKGWTPK